MHPCATAILISTMLVATAAAGAAEPTRREWQFAATLDGSPIGEHVFRVRDDGEHVEVESRASFDVRILGFSLYSYDHRARERWRAGCLTALDSRTDDNGTQQTLSGELSGDAFVVERESSLQRLPACTFTFAYWNPAMREQSRLLNPQTGDYVDVSISPQGIGSIEVGGSTVVASKHLLRGKELEIALWYDAATGDWVGLDSTTSRGAVVSYRLRRTAR